MLMPLICMISYLEKDFSPRSASDTQVADAIVVLGGMGHFIKSEDSVYFDLSEASDRIFLGIELFKNEKAPTLILMSGKAPWNTGKTEGDYLKELAIKYGIPE
jgi:hypothetical protein